MRHALLALVLAFPFAVSAQSAPVPCRAKALDDSTPYDAVYRKACHNCYERQYADSLAAALDLTTSIEIDFWDVDPKLGAKPGYWYVAHHAGNGNDNNCSAPGDLAACLGDVVRWSEAHPGHEAITIFIDKKDFWAKGRQPADLDALIAKVIPRKKLFTPADLKGKAATLRAAVETRGWPKMAELRGKILLAMTGGPKGQRNETEHAYVKARGRRALIFAAPDGVKPEDVTGVPAGFDAQTASWVAFHNMKFGNQQLGETIRRHHHVGRIWGVEERDEAYRAMVSQCMGFIGMYKIQETGFLAGQMSGQLELAP